MPKILDHKSQSLTKLLLLGDSKAGKTGSLISLVKAGYKLRIVDLDGLLDILRTLVVRECPEADIDFVSLRDNHKTTDFGPILDGPPRAFVKALKLMDWWRYDDVDLGKPAEWGPDCVLVVDSLSRLCDAAYDWAFVRAPVGKSGDIDGRAVYGDGQDAIETMLATLTAPSYNTNVIVIAHIQYMDMPDGSRRGYPQGLGQKLSPKIPQYFPNVVLYEKNRAGQRMIRTNSTPLIDLSNTMPFDMQPEFPIETGLASFFATLRGKGETTPQIKQTPKLLKRI